MTISNRAGSELRRQCSYAVNTVQTIIMRKRYRRLSAGRAPGVELRSSGRIIDFVCPELRIGAYN